MVELDYLLKQFNYILWEVEDILLFTKGTYNNNRYGGKTITEWLLVILEFIDNWILYPAGYIDYL